jgi:hypothetical protein
VGKDAKSNSRLCFTFVNVTTPRVPRIPLPTKFAAAEKHMARLLPYEDYSYLLRTTHFSRMASDPVSLVDIEHETRK